MFGSPLHIFTSTAGIALPPPTSSRRPISSSLRISALRRKASKSEHPILLSHRDQSHTLKFWIGVLVLGGLVGLLHLSGAVPSAASAVPPPRSRVVSSDVKIDWSRSRKISPFTPARQEHTTFPTPPPLSAPQELAALLQFLLSNPLHRLSPSISPDDPLPPDTILDASLPTSPDARESALQQMVSDFWARWPVVVVGRSTFQLREIRRLLLDEKYFGGRGEGLGIIELGGRADDFILPPILARITGTTTLPLVFVGSVYVGSLEALLSLEAGEELFPRLRAARADVGRELRDRLEQKRIKDVAHQAREDAQAKRVRAF